MVLRHQVSALECQLGGKKVCFTPADRVLLAALLRRLRPQVLRMMRLLARHGTVLRWHRDLIGKRCRREFLDRTLIWNQRHLMIVLREYEDFCDTHRPHRTLSQAASWAFILLGALAVVALFRASR